MATLWTPGGPHKATIHSNYSFEALGAPTSALASVVWPSANLAIYSPFVVVQPIIVTQLFCHNGATVSGNVDMNIYDAAGTRLTPANNVAQSGVNVLQLFNIADITIGPGVFYFGLVLDNTTGTMLRGGLPALAESLRGIGLAQQAAAYPLPATATFAPIASAYNPACGLIIGPRSSI